MDSFIQMWISISGTLLLEDGDGINGDLCFAMYKAYTFNATVSADYGLENVSYVNLTLDYGVGNENLMYSWNGQSYNFTEIYDPNNFVEITSTSANSTNNSIDKWYIHFKLIFNWSYPDENSLDCALNVTHKNGIEHNF